MLFQVNYPFDSRFGLTSPNNPPVPLVCDDVLPCLLLLFRWVFSILIWLSLAFSIIMILITGLKIIVSPQEFKNYSKNLIWIIIGLVSALVSYSLVLLIERIASTGSIG
ncbi:MAG: hypothetical protein KatS3mg094_289 [Candidatus Parcubacteria bacterium]|nr:MAG: hypothetical protein KatS3mg094_289 [Candidatus Parcubacteria bacterium]